MGPTSALVGGHDDVAGRPRVGLADGRIDHVGVDGIGRDALDAVEVPIAQPVGQGDPDTVGVIPTIGPAHVRAGIDKALQGPAVGDSRDGTARGYDNVLPGVGLGAGQSLKTEKEERGGGKGPENPFKSGPGMKNVFNSNQPHSSSEVSAWKTGFLRKDTPRGRRVIYK